MDLYCGVGLKKGSPNDPHARRLRALMAVLGYDPAIRGNQQKFAKTLKIQPNRLTNVLQGYPLSWQLTALIIRRYPRVSTDFLFLGKPGGHLDRELEQQLIDYEENTGTQVFTRPRS